uniref:J domain-containing protein n=1 Tax=Polytomella parva TaxID=51329 RepID=A0A7S0V4F8_9CHLO|mmetsp:Transcript_29579/g.54286  ORF Transcript_29579/g.54286 Transcript_29579/m.54286 type:complete len:374 (+) Transcript_29579:60-1181(+)
MSGPKDKSGKGLDYYDILSLTRHANDLDVRRAYRRLALKYHPDVNMDENEAEEFFAICEAYDVLSNPKTKGTYDLYGEETLKSGLFDSTGTKVAPYRFDPKTTPAQVFERFFGTNNPYEALELIASQFETLTTEPPPAKGAAKIYPLELTLEEIFHGCLKRVKHKRMVQKDDITIEEDRELTIDVKPGMPSGTRFIFEGEGNIQEKTVPGPVIFVLKPRPHPLFSRRGDDLVYKVTLPLYQSLIGALIEIPTLDGRTLKIPTKDVVTPGTVITVQGEGLPRPNATAADVAAAAAAAATGLAATPSTAAAVRGSLVIEINLLFPAHLTETQKMLFKAAFFLPPIPNEEQKKAVRDFEAAFFHETKGWSNCNSKN